MAIKALPFIIVFYQCDKCNELHCTDSQNEEFIHVIKDLTERAVPHVLCVQFGSKTREESEKQKEQTISFLENIAKDIKSGAIVSDVVLSAPKFRIVD